MTAVPGRVPGTVRLICDSCGDALDQPDHLVREEELVWPVISEAGWSGSAFATGRHLCPACPATSAPPSAEVPPSGPPGAVVARGAGEALVAEVTGTLDRHVTDTVQAALEDPAGRCAHVVLDLGGVATVDPNGLSGLVRVRQVCRRRRGTVCLAAPSRFVLAVLHTMRLTEAFPCFPDRSAALAWSRSSTPGTERVSGRSGDAAGRARPGGARVGGYRRATSGIGRRRG
ncbi:STAS domain-containing protein [Catenuloplanes indicus]|uniref:Anti-anti-sigma factor n=1 Tax=Catenuloplanes indicus TaxID=137267 RepID=A0AAE3VWV3_9ACTN|nr:STAS domain-containing protein [Catenuloplanes indicus]MDQ0365165.1 anti-anti-sigma factor [Catenuloplanes indicus]